MFSLTAALVLFAALLHATWNALLHGNRDRFASMTWMTTSMAVAATVGVFLTGWPASRAWPYIVASGLIHIVYNVSLLYTYRSSDSAQAYPIARGSSPLIVSLGAAWFAHESMRSGGPWGRLSEPLKYSWDLDSP